jgi:hypothetical protein
MPFIHIKSLPFEEAIDVTGIIKNIAADFSVITGIDLNHIHTTWEVYPSGHYAKGDKAAEHQPAKQYPLIVDLLTPDFYDPEVIALMLETIADSIATRAAFPKNNIFINHRQAHSGMVFDDGKIVHW